MSGPCRGSNNATTTIPTATPSLKIPSTTAPCPKGFLARVDFLKIIGNTGFPVTKDIACGRCKLTLERLTLDNEYIEAFRNYSIPVIYILPEKVRIILNYYLGNTKKFCYPIGKIKIRFTNSNITTSYKENIITIHDILEFDASALKYGTEFNVEFYSITEIEPKEVLSGKIKFKIFERNHFSQKEYERFKSMTNVIAPKASSQTPSEYSQNYCMQAADRYIGALSS